MDGREGFTYVEVMLAVVMLGLILLPVAAMFTGGLEVIGTAGMSTEAKELVRQGMETAQAGGAQLAETQAGTPLVESIPPYTRTTIYTAEAVNASPYTLDLWKVEVTVSWQGPKGAQSVSIATLLADY